jgi:hypothetical protein
MTEGNTMTATATSIADLKNAPAVRTQNVVAGFNDMHSFELLQRIGKLLSASSLVPEVYRGAEGLPNAIVALNMAQRMGADPLMVMQNLYVVHGRPAWSAQFLIATFNRNGRYSSIRYRWQGKENADDWGCRAYATEFATGNEIVGPLVTIALAKAEKWFDRSGTKWKTIPELMLTYRAAAWMVRTNAPEIAMGLPTADEVDDIVTLTPEQYRVEQVAAAEHARAPQTVPVPEPATAPQAAPSEPGSSFTYAEVADAIEKAKDSDAHNLAVDMIRGVADPAQRAELAQIARKKRDATEAAARG